MKAISFKSLKMFVMILFLTASNLTYVPAFLGMMDVSAQSAPPTLEKVEEETGKLVKMIFNVAKIVIGVVLVIGLIFVIWMVSQNHPKSKEAVIGWIIGVGLYAIGMALVG